MTQLQGQGRVEGLCAVAGVSRASYYRDWARTAPGREETQLRDLVQRLSLENPRYGYRRITALVRREGWPVNHKRIARIRRQDNLLTLRRPAFRPATTDSVHAHTRWPNLVRNLVLTGVNQVWVADITYVRLDEAFVYLAVVLDVFSRKVVGWALADHLRAELAIEALEKALAERDVADAGLIHHSDQGVQYACGDYTQRLLAAGIQPSMTLPGRPWDNGFAESFMKTLKVEEVDGSAYRDLDDARSRIGEFIERVYNRQRLHSALRYLSPEEFEARQTQSSTSSTTYPQAPPALRADGPHNNHCD
jgi:transposase InsO family protein